MILNELEAFLILFSCYTVDQLPILSSVPPFLFSFPPPHLCSFPPFLFCETVFLNHQLNNAFFHDFGEAVFIAYHVSTYT